MRLEDYRLVFVPCLYSASEATLRALDSYVREGGQLAVTFRSGFSDEHLKIYVDKEPHILNRCLGISYNQFTVPKNVSLDLCFAPSHREAKVQEWMELVMADTAVSLARYRHPAWGNYSAVTENSYGKGSAFYIGCFFDDATMDILTRYILERCGFPAPDLSFPVIIKRGRNDYGRQIACYLNYSADTQTISYEGTKGRSLLNDVPVKRDDSLVLPPWGVAIIETE